MFKNIFIKRILFSIEALFLSIRSNPEDKNFLQVLKIYEKHITPEMNFNNKTIKLIKKDLISTVDFSGKQSMLDDLEGLFLGVKVRHKKLIYRSLEIFNYIFKEMIAKVETNETDKLRTMASSVHNYPGFLVGNNKINPKLFFDEHLLFYKRRWNENFMCKYKQVFKKEFMQTLKEE